MFCQNCGNAIPDGGPCPRCGATVQPGYKKAPIAEQPAANPGKNMGMISMILGIVSVTFSTVCAWMPGSNLAPICAVVGLILGIIAQKESKAAGVKNNMATAGIVTSAITIALQLCVLALAVLVMVLYFACYMLLLVGVMSSASTPYYY